MAVTAAQPPDLREPPSWRRTKNRIATVLMVLSFVLVIIPLGFVLFTVVAKGASIISWSFLTGPIPVNVAPANVGGIGPAIVGTLVITGLATVIAVPLGILGAVYLNEYGGNRPLARLIGFFSDVMTGVPSIIMGLFIFAIWVLHFGYSGLAGAFALGCLMLPIVIRSTDEMLKLVPNSLREGELRPRRHQGPRHRHGGVAGGGRRDRQRRPAGGGPGRGGDGAAAVHHPGGDHSELERVQRHQHVTAVADLRERVVAVRRRPGPRLGRGAHAHRARLYPDGRRPVHYRTIRPVPALGRSWNSSLSRTSPPSSTSPPTSRSPSRWSAGRRTHRRARTVFHAQGVSCYYGSFRAVTDVSLDIYEHEITAFIGPSGCGKTTVLRTLNRMNDLVVGAHVEGQVSYRGEPLYDKGVSPIAVRRRIGMVFQKPNPFPKSIFDNVAYGPRINGERNKGKLNEIVEKSLRQAALWDEVKDRLGASGLGLSGGQAQRLCIARTLAVEPDVVLMDEPCSALDPIATGAIEDLMREIKSRYTIVIVTHNMQQATRVSDRTAFFSVLRQRGERYPDGRARRVRPDRADLPGPARQPHPGLRDRPDGLS